MSTVPVASAGGLKKAGGGHAIRRLINGIADVLGLMAALIVVLLLLAIVADVAWAGLGGPGIKGLVEYGEVAVVGIVFFSIAQAQKTGSHVAVDVLVERFHPRVSAALRIVVLMGMGMLTLWLAYENLLSALDSFERREERFGLVHVPIWPARFAVPIGFGAMALQCALQAWDELHELRHSNPAGTRTSQET